MSGLHTEKSRSVLPKIDAALLHSSVLLVCHAGVTIPATARPNDKLELRFMPPTAAAGQLQQQGTPNPPPFRAGFHYERAQTPQLPARKKEQQRQAQHKAFKAAQAISSKPRQQPSAAAAQDCQAEFSAPAPAVGSSSTEAQASGSQQTDNGCGGNSSSSSSGSSKLSPSCSRGMQGAFAQQSAQQANLEQQQQPRQALQQQPQPQQQLAQTQQQQQQQQQPQQQPYVPGSNLSSARGSIGALQSQHRHTKSSMIGAAGPPTHYPSSVGSPVIGSQSLLQAMAFGQGKQALSSLLAESLGMAAAGTTADAVDCGPPGTWRSSHAQRAVAADATAGTEGCDSPGSWRSSSSSSPKHRGPAGRRPLGLTLPQNSSTSKSRRGTGEAPAAAAAAGSRAGRVTGSSRPVSSSGIFRCRGQPRESDVMSEDLPSLDSPHPQPGFDVGHVAAALVHSIRHLRDTELQQLQTPQLGGLQTQQQAANATQPAQQQQQPQKQPQRQKPREQDVAELTGPAGKGSAAAPGGKGQAGKGSSSTAPGGGSSSSKGGSKGEPPLPEAGGSTAQQRQASSTTQEAAAAARSSTAAGPAAKATAAAAAGTAATRVRAPATAAAAAAAAYGADSGGAGGAKTGAVRAAGGKALQAAAGSEKVGSPTPLTGLKLQARALAAPAEVVAAHSKSDLLLAQAFGTPGPATAQQQQQQQVSLGAGGNSSSSSAAVGAVGGSPQPAAVAAGGLQSGLGARLGSSTLPKPALAAAAPPPPSTAAPQPATAVSSSAASQTAAQPCGVSMDAAAVAQFGGRRSPARDRVLRASWDKQRLQQQQQEQLQPGRRGGAAAVAAAAAACGDTSCAPAGSLGADSLQQQTWNRQSLTPEPYTGTIWQAGSSPSSSSSGLGSAATQQQPLPALLQRTAGCVAAGAGRSLQQQQIQGGRQAHHLACSLTQSIQQQLHTTAQQAADVSGAAMSPAATSALGLRAGEVERLVARYHTQGRDSGLDLYPSTFNLDNALASRQQVQALAAAIPQLPDLRMLLLRNNDLRDNDMQLLAAALLNPAAAGICGLDLGFNQFGPEAMLLLLLLLHKPPQALLQARRRSTAEAASDCEGFGSRSQNPSSGGGSSSSSSKNHASGRSSSQAGGTTAANSSSGGCSVQAGVMAAQQQIDAGSTGSGSGSTAQWARSFRPQRQSMLQRNSLQQQQTQAYADHAMLLQLVLCSNRIGDAGAEVVCKVVGTGDCMLQLLDLSGCGITERLSGCLKGMLEGARQLKVLRLGWNMLGPKGAKALAEGLKYCSSGLEQLYLPWSGITDTGASHIAKALESNASVRLIDMSGCQVSAGTCVVLAETLLSNCMLEAVILQDNPLGALGVQKLLKAVHGGHVRHVDIAGCSFLGPPTRQLAGTGSATDSAPPTDKLKGPRSGSGKKSPKKTKPKSAGAGAAATGTASKRQGAAAAGGKKAGGKSARAAVSAGLAAAGAKQVGGGQTGSAAAAFDVREPDGCYTLDLALPSDRQVAIELLKLTEDHGLDSWVSPCLDKQPFRIAGVTKQSLPNQGTLTVTFAAKHQLSREAQPLSDPEFRSLWTQQVQPRATPSRPSLLLQLPEPQQLLQHPGADWTDTEGVYSWAGGQAAAGLQGSLAGAGGQGLRMRAVSDGWKLELLQVLIQDCYFTSAQAGQIVAAFSYGSDMVEAAVKVFGRVVDPENFADQAYLPMNAWQVELADSRIGCLRLFSPDNPTGKYSLLLSHPAQRLVGVRLVELFCQQHIEGLCSYPHSVCFTAASLDDKALPEGSLEDPLRIRLPKSGIFKVSFVDLRPVPPTAAAVTPDGFAVLLAMLTGAEKLDGWELSQAVAADLETKLSVVGRFDTWSTSHGPFSGKVGALRRLRQPGASTVAVRDTAGFLEGMHLFAIHHYLTGSQLQELLKLLPATATELRVELCSRFWARLTDRAKTWSDVMRALTAEQQVLLAQRLGIANTFDPVRPSMHYRLRMWRADEHQIAWRLHRMALNAAHTNAFVGLAIDGKQKKIAQTANLWSIMRGNAADSDTPTVTLDFEFVWQDTLLPTWAAVTIQSAWRACLIRKAAPAPLLRLRYESLSGRPQHALGVRASITGGKQHNSPLSHRSQQQTHRSYGTHGSTAGACNSPSIAGQTYRSSGLEAGRSGPGAAGGTYRTSAVGNPYRDAAGSFAGLGSGAGCGGAGVGAALRRHVVGEQPEWDPLVTTARSMSGAAQVVSQLC